MTLRKGGGMGRPMANLWFLLLLHLTGVSVTTSQLCVPEIPWDYNGTIESPGFPHENYGNQHCWYSFSLPNTFSNWRISFTYFNLPNTSCDRDYIEVYGYSPIQRFCQNSTPPDLTGVRGILFYSSLNSSAGFGFQANVSMVFECGNPNIRLQENISYSLRFRQDYPMPGRCEWEVTADQGLAIMMIGYLWYSDYQPINRHVKMYRGPIKDESSLITIKSSYNMVAVDEASNSILIEYIANYSSYFEILMALQASENSTCGSVTNASAGDIYFSAYPSHSINGYQRNAICVWTIEAEEDEVIQLLITELYIQSEIPGCNDLARSYLEIYDGSQTDNSLLVRACSAYELPGYNPVTSTTRRLVVVLTLDEELGFTQAYFTARYKSFNESAFLRDCGGDISGDQGVVSSPNYPANYDNLRVCEWRITLEDSFTIRIDIHDLDIRPSNYGCHGDSLLITGAYPTGQIHRLCGSINGLVIYSASNNLTMRFVSDWENNGRGFNASWRKACELSLQTSSGWIQSLRFPATYLDNLSCSYFIGTNTYQPGISYTFTFETFDLQEPDSNGSCIYDYLEILQVPSYNPGYFVPPEAKKVCGKGPTENLRTYFPTTLHFVTDGNITKGGFNISFLSTMAGCGESLLVGEKGFITSPNYPGIFPQFLRCTTTIRVQPGHKIILIFTSFFLSENLQPDNGQECWRRTEAFLDIYESLSTGSAWIGTYCGYTSPQPITSTSNELTLIFTSNNNYYATGFNATYVSTSSSTGKY
ncbi:cubilin-like isoform X2 [Pomacea canaliculata]|uniref:cubilin-like isoform X2 n=1 Tax=Pomacea canaliculata TaxID=400727 RepID=UPI000D72B9B2|nr:cubilin-like isoform X2 [Pomacea canaliculata]